MISVNVPLPAQTASLEFSSSSRVAVVGMKVYSHPPQLLSHHSPPGHAGYSLSPVLVSGLIFLSLILLLASEQVELPSSQGSAGREGGKVQLCQHQGCWHAECCCVKADAQPWHWLALLVPLGGGAVCQFWVGGRLKGSPAVRALRGLLGRSWGAGGSQLSRLAVPWPVSHPRSCFLGQWLRHTSHKLVASGEP